MLGLQVCPYLRASHAINAQQSSVQLSWIIWLYTKRIPFAGLCHSFQTWTSTLYSPVLLVGLSSFWTHLQAKLVTYFCMQRPKSAKILSFPVVLIALLYLPEIHLNNITRMCCVLFVVILFSSVSLLSALWKNTRVLKLYLIWLYLILLSEARSRKWRNFP